MNDITLQQALSRRRTCRTFADHPVPLAAVQRLLWAAQGRTDESGKRTAPSAHALCPLRLFVVAGNIEGLASGLHAVGPEDLALALTRSADLRPLLQNAALEEQPWIGEAAGIVTLCADFIAPSAAFAEQPPYGLRGERYIYIEAGAAAQNLQLQAVAEGLACVLVAGFRDEATAEILGLKAPLAPVLHLCFGWPA